MNQVASSPSPACNAVEFRILLVDDDPDHRLLGGKSLETLGAEVVTVANAPDGIQSLESQAYDLVIADYRMPGMDGLSFLRALNERRIEVPVVLVTGVGSEGLAVEALRLGAQDYVIKETGYLELLPSVALRAIASFRSAQQLQETRRQLAESEQRYRDLVHGVDAVVWEADPETWEYSFVSQWAESLLGYPVKRWLEDATFWAEILHPEDRDRAIESRAEATRARRDYECTYRLLAASGDTVWVRDKVRVLARPGGAESLRGLMVDITAQKLAQEQNERLHQQLVQAQKMESMGTLVGGIAHGFNNLLQGILGYSGLALATVEETAECHGFLKAIVESGERAAQLTAQLLAVGRRQDPKIELLDLNALVDESLRMLRHMIPTTIDIETRKESALWGIRADPSQLQQVLLNLCVNARDAMTKGGRLVLSTQNVTLTRSQAELRLEAQEGPYVVLTVSDTGEGMSQATKERIFDPFYTSKKVGEGTGLGLAVVYGVTRSHRGWVDVETEMGAGATFRVYLPAVEEEVPRRTSASHDVTGGTETILVVDDEPMVLNLALEVLLRHGYQVLGAGDGVEALQVFEDRSRRVDLVVLDLNMPGLDGLECARRLRHLEPGVRLIISSGRGTEVDLDGEALPSVPKPYSPEKLARAVRTVLDAE